MLEEQLPPRCIIHQVQYPEYCGASHWHYGVEYRPAVGCRWWGATGQLDSIDSIFGKESNKARVVLEPWWTSGRGEEEEEWTKEGRVEVW